MPADETVKPIRRRTSAKRANTEESILSAAYACFERYGIRKTTIDDIAQEAGVSRATMYRYFASKEQVLDKLSSVETAKVNAELRQRFVARETIEDALVECLFLSTRIAADNPYVQALMDFDVPSRSADPTSSPYQVSHQMWGSLLRDALAKGELADDRTLDDYVSWLMLSIALLLIKVKQINIDDEALRDFIRRFLVEPMLPVATIEKSRQQPRVKA